jgi:hypothetical protein
MRLLFLAVGLSLGGTHRQRGRCRLGRPERRPKHLPLQSAADSDCRHLTRPPRDPLPAQRKRARRLQVRHRRGDRLWAAQFGMQSYAEVPGGPGVIVSSDCKAMLKASSYHNREWLAKAETGADVACQIGKYDKGLKIQTHNSVFAKGRWYAELSTITPRPRHPQHRPPDQAGDGATPALTSGTVGCT